jgi:hypothetical protein
VLQSAGGELALTDLRLRFPVRVKVIKLHTETCVVAYEILFFQYTVVVVKPDCCF